MFVHEPAYLMGIIAGSMTESDVIGAVAAFPFPNVNLPLNGYIEGAKSVNPDVEAKVTYIESWFDPPKGRESAAAQFAAGADFIYAERFGPFEAVSEKPNSFAFGHFVDQNSLAPEIVVSSAIAKWDPSISAAIDGWWAHAAEGATYNAPTERIVFTMKDGGADLAPYHDLSSDRAGGRPGCGGQGQGRHHGRVPDGAHERRAHHHGLSGHTLPVSGADSWRWSVEAEQEVPARLGQPATSPSTCAGERSTACSVRTVPARARWPSASTAPTAPSRAPSPSRASTSCWAAPRDAIAAGIGMVHQHFALAPALSVIDNVLVGTTSRFLLDLREAEQRLQALARSTGCTSTCGRSCPTCRWASSNGWRS